MIHQKKKKRDSPVFSSKNSSSCNDTYVTTTRVNGTRFTVQCERNRGTMIQRSIPIKRRMNKETRGFELFEDINYYHV